MPDFLLAEEKKTSSLTCQEKYGTIEMMLCKLANGREAPGMLVDKSVIVLFRQLNLFLNRELEAEKLTSADVLYLALLYEQDGRTQDEMAETYAVDRAATTRSMQGLERKGLVRREMDDKDHRVRRVYLTEKAMQYRGAIRRMSEELASVLFEGMDEAAVAAFKTQTLDMSERLRRLNQARQQPYSKGEAVCEQ